MSISARLCDKLFATSMSTFKIFYVGMSRSIVLIKGITVDISFVTSVTLIGSQMFGRMLFLDVSIESCLVPVFAIAMWTLDWIQVGIHMTHMIT